MPHFFPVAATGQPVRPLWKMDLCKRKRLFLHIHKNVLRRKRIIIPINPLNEIKNLLMPAAFNDLIQLICGGNNGISIVRKFIHNFICHINAGIVSGTPVKKIAVIDIKLLGPHINSTGSKQHNYRQYLIYPRFRQKSQNQIHRYQHYSQSQHMGCGTKADSIY